MHYVPDYLSQVHVRLSSRTPEVDFCGKRTEKKKKPNLGLEHWKLVPKLSDPHN